MSATGTVAVASSVAPSDAELIAGVRAGDDAAFEELYRRYNRRIGAFVRRLVRDEARAEDVTQEAFFSALRRMRATDAEIAFKPWIYEIARNAAIDLYRRTSRAEEVSISREDLLHPSDRGRLVGSVAPDSALMEKERMDHLRGALDELSETHHRILVMRELEGLSYREIGQRMELSRPAVESTLFRARRRLEREYEELEAGRRCDSIRMLIARAAEGIQSDSDARRLARHARRCSTCRRRARELGVEPLARRPISARAAALLPLPFLLRRRAADLASGGAARGGDVGTTLGPFTLPGGEFGAAVAERITALVAAAALAGAGSAVLGGVSGLDAGGPSVQHGLGPALEGRQITTPSEGQRPTPLRKERTTPRERPSRQATPGGRGGSSESAPPPVVTPAPKPQPAPQDPGVGGGEILKLRSAPSRTPKDEDKAPIRSRIQALSSTVQETEQSLTQSQPIEVLTPQGGTTDGDDEQDDDDGVGSTAASGTSVEGDD